jgi:hypothetical protein
MINWYSTTSICVYEYIYTYIFIYIYIYICIYIIGAWDYVILDEGHIIKNPSTKLSKSMHMLKVNITFNTSISIPTLIMFTCMIFTSIRILIYVHGCVKKIQYQIIKVYAYANDMFNTFSLFLNFFFFNRFLNGVIQYCVIYISICIYIYTCGHTYLYAYFYTLVYILYPS